MEQAHTAQDYIQWCHAMLHREQKVTWGCSQGKTLGTVPAMHAPSPALTALLLGLCAPACPLAGKNLLSPWHCNMLHLRQNMPSRPTHSSSTSTTKPPLALVYGGAQGLHHPRPSTFLSASQANLAGGRVLENGQALLADPYKSFTIFLPVLTEMKSEQRSRIALL